MNPRKQVELLYRNKNNAHSWRAWLNPNILLVICGFTMFLFVLFGMPFYSVEGSGATPAQAVTLAPEATMQATAPEEATQARVEPTRTPFPAEFYTNSQQTIGITFAGAVLVLIVVIGVIMYIPKKLEK